MVDTREIAVVWSWDDGTRCVLCAKDRMDLFELRVLQDGRAVHREPVTDVLDALTKTAPELERDCLVAKMRAE